MLKREKGEVRLKGHTPPLYSLAVTEPVTISWALSMKACMASRSGLNQ